MDEHFMRLIGRNQGAAFISFQRDGKTAKIDIVGGVLVYDGDLEIDTSARMLFDYLVRVVGAEWLASKLAPGGMG